MKIAGKRGKKTQDLRKEKKGERKRKRKKEERENIFV
jgi:hypothetical protein